jgi:hypothetical protein
VSLLRGDALSTAEQRIAAQVLVALLHKAEPRFIPDQSCIHSLSTHYAQPEALHDKLHDKLG